MQLDGVDLMICRIMNDSTDSATHWVVSSVLMWSYSPFCHYAPSLPSHNCPPLCFSSSLVYNYYFAVFILWQSVISCFFPVLVSQSFFHCQPCAHISGYLFPIALLSVLFSSWPCADVGSDRTTWLTKRGWIPFGSPVDIKRSCMLCVEP